MGQALTSVPKGRFFYAGIVLFSYILPTIKLLNHNIKVFKSAGSGHMFFSLVLHTKIYLQ